MNFRSIINQISEDKIEEALENFDSFFSNIDEYKKEALLLKARLNEIKQKDRQQLLDINDISIEKSKIRKSVLDVFSGIETLIENGSSDSEDDESAIESVQEIVQNAIEDKGYTIDSQILSDHSSYYFKAKRNSFVEKDFYVIQVLNWYKLSSSQSVYNQEYLNFFSKSRNPFVDLVEFYPGNPSYLIRKYAPGIDLSSLLKSGLKLSLLRTLNAAIVISEGLLELNKSKIFYNNLIPDQIIMDSNCQELQLLPLNIFEENGNVVTWKNLKDGIKYMSPEQLKLAGNKLEQNKLNIGSNQYSLGLIIFYMIMGESLFDGKGLPSIYEDRIDQRNTVTQLNDFYEEVKNQLLRFSLDEKTAAELSQNFQTIFQKLIKISPDQRHENFEDFISELEFLKLHIEKEKRKFDGEYLNSISGAYERSLSNNENIINEFYDALIEALPSKKSTQNKNSRNIRFRFAFDYLFSTVSNIENSDFLREGLSSLVKYVHFDFTIEEFEIYFQILKEKISSNDSEWSDETDKAWKHFSINSLDAIEGIFSPK